MAKKPNKAAVKKKAAPAKAKAKPSKKPVAKAVKASAPSGKAKPVKKATPKAPAPKKPTGSASKQKPVKPVKPAAAPAKAAVNKPVAKPAPPAKPAVKAPPVAPPPVQKVKPAGSPQSKPVVVPPASDNDVVHIVKKGPPPAEFRAQLAALKRKKGAVDKKIFKTEIVNPHVIKDVTMAPEKTQKKSEPKGKFTLEFIVHAPVTLLYDFLSTPNGLAEWFADEVDIRDNVYKFNWDGAIQHANILSAKLDNHLRLHWSDKPEGTYFEFRIVPDELLPNEVALLVTDFGDNEDDIRTSRQLWEAQIHRLMKALGSY
jgi:uncharacterized protein YndB with AHSA1/START domain